MRSFKLLDQLLSCTFYVTNVLCAQNKRKKNSKRTINPRAIFRIGTLYWGNNKLNVRLAILHVYNIILLVPLNHPNPSPRVHEHPRAAGVASGQYALNLYQFFIRSVGRQ